MKLKGITAGVVTIAALLFQPVMANECPKAC
jgi:hypothetical protein